MIKILKTVSDVQEYRKFSKTDNVGFVPTMGTLHEGHLELIRNSKKINDITIVSIFVNPAQFNNRNDFNTYPNRLESDLQALIEIGVDAVMTPSEADIYPNGYHYKLTEDEDSIGLCGTARPGHFDGVLTVLIKLFNLVRPSDVYMGLKDYQQYRLVKNMVQDLFLNIAVHGVDTVREDSGLALSSRNVNLSLDQKKIADQFACTFAQDLPLAEIRKRLELLDLKIDYLEERWGRKFAAVFIGAVRLIDNRPSSSVIGNSQMDSVLTLKRNPPVAQVPPAESSDLVSSSSLSDTSAVNSSSKKILFKMSGSIACYKGCDVISKLVQQGHEVKIAVSPDVFQFVGQATLEGLVGSSVYVDMYKPGEVMSHIHLNDWCDITVLCPASANTLAKVALGLSDNLITALALSTDTSKPYLIFPAMNARMLQAVPTQSSFSKISETHKKVIFGESGHLACGHVGAGRLAEPSIILNSIQNELKDLDESSQSHLAKKPVTVGSKSETNRPVKGKILKKVLVTAGGTTEPIDPVRFVTNSSTGETGLKICESLTENYDVYLLAAQNMKGKVEAQLEVGQVEYYSTFNDLEKKLGAILSQNSFEAVIHLAAVSDYSPSLLYSDGHVLSLPTEEKLSSASDFTVEFKKNKKLITEIRNMSLNKKVKVIGFKLLRTDDQDKIQREIAKILKTSDCVVVNSLERISEKKHFYEIYNLSGLLFHGSSKVDMAQDISKILNSEVVL